MSRRVLVVDGDDNARGLLTLMLGGAGYDVRTAQNGAVALGVLGEWQPDVILLDLMMPVMNGWVFRRAQLANARFADIPVVVTSTLYQPAPCAAGLAPAAVLPRPFRSQRLCTTVNQVAGWATAS
jgi:CheY-like chemotaxis protein